MKKAVSLVIMAGLFILALGFLGASGDSIAAINQNGLYALLSIVGAFIVGAIGGVFKW